MPDTRKRNRRVQGLLPVSECRAVILKVRVQGDEVVPNGAAHAGKQRRGLTVARVMRT